MLAFCVCVFISRASRYLMFGYSGQEPAHSLQLQCVPTNRGHGLKLTWLYLWFMIFCFGLVWLPVQESSRCRMQIQYVTMLILAYPFFETVTKSQKHYDIEVTMVYICWNGSNIFYKSHTTYPEKCEWVCCSKWYVYINIMLQMDMDTWLLNSDVIYCSSSILAWHFVKYM